MMPNASQPNVVPNASTPNAQYVPTMLMTRGKLEVLRGRLIAHLQRSVTWNEFAGICNVSTQTLRNIRMGRTSGSLDTANSILSALAARGLSVQREDLISFN